MPVSALQVYEKKSMGLSWTIGWLTSGAIAFGASTYVYKVVRFLAQGWHRLAASIPVFLVYAFTPWLFDPSTHCFGTAILFFSLTWLASFKLLTLCWGYGPAADPSATQSLLRFHIALALPIHVRPAGKAAVQNLKSWKSETLAVSGDATGEDLREGTANGRSVPGVLHTLVDALDSETSWLVLIGRCCLKMLGMRYLCSLMYKETLAPMALNLVYSLELFLFATIIEEGLGAVANLISGVELGPHFDQPYLASSLEDFWAHRWNIMVSACLKETVYLPVLHLLTRSQLVSPRIVRPRRNDDHQTHATAVLRSASLADKDLVNSAALSSATRGQKAHLRSGKAQHLEVTQNRSIHSYSESANPEPFEGTSTHPQPLNPPIMQPKPPVWTRLTAMLATFFVSGVMHELAIFYLAFHMTGEVTAFFTLHGIATGLEMALKRRWRGRRKLPRIVSILLTVGFAVLTGKWLFFAPVLSLGIVERINQNICGVFHMPFQLD